MTWIYAVLPALIVLVALAAIVAAQPARFRVSRSTTIDAPPEVVFAHVNNLRKWEAWNPFGKADPKLERRYEGPAEGAGSEYSWSGDRSVGAGKMTITQIVPAQRIDIRLEFLKPFAAVNQVEFAFDPVGEDANQTRVSWTMNGSKVFITKAIGLVVSMDKMIGGSFEQGLADLKAVAESEARAKR